MSSAAKMQELVAAAKRASREIGSHDAWLQSWNPDYGPSGPVRGPLREAAKRLREAVKAVEA